MADAPDVSPAEPAPGGCGCGPTGCITALVVLSVVLLAVMIAVALLRPWPTPLLPRS
ncbi:MAG TPA: hypothetical protein VHG51_01545 [Longimicrobiaceae bacterium]|nr:hypothetical protein [Longimicrobiaceae bacterium]